MLAPDKKIILRYFFDHKVIYLCAEFPLCQTPATDFLPINITFFVNIWLEYFFNKFLRVFHQSKVELSDLGENWAKTSPLLLQIFESSNCVDRRIVPWAPELIGLPWINNVLCFLACSEIDRFVTFEFKFSRQCCSCKMWCRFRFKI